MSKEECGVCKFWGQIEMETQGLEDSFGHCRRYPPVRDMQDMYDKAMDKEFKENTADRGFSPIVQVTRWSQPLSFSEDWCGEFKPE